MGLQRLQLHRKPVVVPPRKKNHVLPSSSSRCSRSSAASSASTSASSPGFYVAQAKAPKPTVMKKIGGATANAGMAKPAIPAKPPTMASRVIAAHKAMSYYEDSTSAATAKAKAVVIDVEMEDSVLNSVPQTPTPDPWPESTSITDVSDPIQVIEDFPHDLMETAFDSPFSFQDEEDIWVVNFFQQKQH